MNTTRTNNPNGFNAIMLIIILELPKAHIQKHKHTEKVIEREKNSQGFVLTRKSG